MRRKLLASQFKGPRDIVSKYRQAEKRTNRHAFVRLVRNDHASPRTSDPAAKTRAKMIVFHFRTQTQIPQQDNNRATPRQQSDAHACGNRKQRLKPNSIWNWAPRVRRSPHLNAAMPGRLDRVASRTVFGELTRAATNTAKPNTPQFAKVLRVRGNCHSATPTNVRQTHQRASTHFCRAAPATVLRATCRQQKPA